jgi:hypothetical protein
MRSHYDKEVCAIAAHPTNHEVLTAGREGILAIWDTESKRQTKYAKLECGADAVAFSNLKVHDQGQNKGEK